MSNPVIEQSTDFMYRNSRFGLSLLKFKQKVCMTVFENAEFQVFYTEDCNAVYNKKEERVYSLEINTWTRLVLKLEGVMEIHVENTFINPK